jgi:hypothetical protein
VSIVALATRPGGRRSERADYCEKCVRLDPALRVVATLILEPPNDRGIPT